jgi:ADP-heptose:LPS heptosyltransferase
LIKELSLAIPDEVETETTSLLQDRSIPRPFATIAPGAAQPNKMWMPDRFVELISRLAQEGLPSVLVGGPDETDLCAQIASGSKLPMPYNLAGTGSLLHTAALIRKSAVFVGNDSGLAHVAATVKTPVVVLSGPGDPREVAPYTDGATTIARPLFCKPCYKNVCWRKDIPLECLQKITVEDVLTACQKYTAEFSR